MISKMVVLILERKDQDNYSAFKYLVDRVFGFHSIVMIEDSNKRKREWASTGLDQYCGNITMKANLKMGGINHSAYSKQGNIEEWLKTTLKLGADVTHPGMGHCLGVLRSQQLWAQSRALVGGSLDPSSFKRKAARRYANLPSTAILLTDCHRLLIFLRRWSVTD